jgi:hypothetical protein
VLPAFGVLAQGREAGHVPTEEREEKVLESSHGFTTKGVIGLSQRKEKKVGA